MLIVNGDTLCPIDLQPMLDDHARSGAEVTLALMPNPLPDHYNGIVLDSRRRVTSVIPKGRATRDTWHFVGVQVVNTGVFSGLADGVPAETMAGVYLQMIAEQPGSIRGWPIDVPFIDVDAARLPPRGARSSSAGRDARAAERFVVVGTPEFPPTPVRTASWPDPSRCRPDFAPPDRCHSIGGPPARRKSARHRTRRRLSAVV